MEQFWQGSDGGEISNLQVVKKPFCKQIAKQAVIQK